uniref:GTP binding protein overexpressed in skeletal muscle n=1 Tax=Laticauda laticaudata TaxID=8630 RepID=A0A8C5WN16_LATLA
MTLNNVTMRRNSASSCGALQPQQQRWSVPTDGKHLVVQKETQEANLQKRYTLSHEEYCRKSWSSESSDSVISTESGNIYRVVLIGEQGVGKTTIASVFAGVHDSLDSDCELLGGKFVPCPRPLS